MIKIKETPTREEVKKEGLVKRELVTIITNLFIFAGIILIILALLLLIFMAKTIVQE